MKIIEIVENKNNVAFDKLNAFRRMKAGPDYPVTGDEQITIPTKKSSRDLVRGPATTSKIPDIKPEINDDLRSIFKQIFTDFKISAEKHNKVPLFSIYKAGDDQSKASLGLSVKTDNNLRVSIASGRTGKIEFYSIDEKDKDRRAAIMQVLIDAGFKYLPTGSKFRFVVKNPSDIQSTFSDFWKMVEEIESLGNDFKISSRGGAGSLITGKQAPYQYYKWLASNIYESTKNNITWGFSRGGGDSGGAYDRFDDLLIIGITKGGIEQEASGRPAYREHVVPCDLINRMGIEICKNSPKTNKHRNQVIMEIAKMIHRNLAIVLCSSNPDSSAIRDKSNDGDREKIDFDNGLMTTMPQGWKDGDNILARFSQCGIPVYKNKTNHPENGKRMAE